MLMCLGVAQLDSANASKIVEESSDLVVDGILGELRVRDQQIGLADVRCQQVISQHQNNDRRLCIDILAQHSGAESTEKNGSDGNNRRVGRWRERSHVLAEEGEVEEHLGRERV